MLRIFLEISGEGFRFCFIQKCLISRKDGSDGSLTRRIPAVMMMRNQTTTTTTAAATTTTTKKAINKIGRLFQESHDLNSTFLNFNEFVIFKIIKLKHFHFNVN